MPLMRERPYSQIVSYIRDYALGVEVRETDGRQFVLCVLRGRRTLISVPCLTLKVRRPYGRSGSGCWKIPKPDLNRAIRKLSADDPAFKDRLDRNAMARRDVERIILLASHNVIRLTLHDGTLPMGFGR